MSSKMLCLVVIDDEVLCLETIMLLLVGTNYRVCPFHKVSEGLEYIYNHAEEVDAVLLDIMMPEITGVEALERLRRHGDTSQIPVILQSGIASESQLGIDLASNRASFIRKPFSRESLITAVEEAVA